MIPLCNQICCDSHPQELCPDNFRNNVNLTKTQVLSALKMATSDVTNDRRLFPRTK